MTILIDPPNAEGHGRLWSHLASDESLAELHAFAADAGVPERGFDRDHYDVPADFYDRMIGLGAEPVTSRELIRRLTAAGLRRRKSQSLRPRPPGRPLLLPPALQPGDLVAVVMTSGPAEPQQLAAGEEILRGWGLRVLGVAAAGHPDLAWLAGTDGERAQWLHDAWLHPDVRAVWTARGGFGSQRLFDHLDWTALARVEPRWLIGCSDLTALHQAFASRLGVSTVHGPGVAGLTAVDLGSRTALKDLLFDGEATTKSGIGLCPGVAEGVLVGGNLAMLASNVGSGYEHGAADSIALLEDVGEAPYRLDRALTQLLRAGWFAGVRAVACGEFFRCGEPELVRKLLAARLGELGVPVVLDLPFGHAERNHPLPLGRLATVDGTGGYLTMRSLHSPAD